MVEGMAFLKLYENKACTRELKKDVNGNYILNVPVLTANAQSPFISNIFVKNEGDHKAYDCNITLISSTITNTSIVTTVVSNVILVVGESRKCTISVPIAQGVTGTYTVTIKVT
jgi:hypothetical protein